VICNQAVAGFVQSLLMRDFADGGKKMRYGFRARMLGEIIKRDVISLWDYQYVHRCGWRNILEGKDFVIFIYLAGGNLTAKDFGEDVIAIIHHNSPCLAELVSASIF